jgi:hypothetical protein
MNLEGSVLLKVSAELIRKESEKEKELLKKDNEMEKELLKKDNEMEKKLLKKDNEMEKELLKKDNEMEKEMLKAYHYSQMSAFSKRFVLLCPLGSNTIVTFELFLLLAHLNISRHFFFFIVCSSQLTLNLYYVM